MPTATDSGSEPTPNRFRFSLRTLFLVILFPSKLQKANRELNALRKEAGYLTLADRTKIHAVALHSGVPDTWRWRLFIPKGHQYSWNIACDEIPLYEVPHKAGATGVSNEPYRNVDNQVVVTVHLRRINDEYSMLSVRSNIGKSRHNSKSRNQMGGTELRSPNDKLQWRHDGSGSGGRQAGFGGTTMIDPKGPAVLLQQRSLKLQADGSFRPSPDPMPGFMVWLKKI